MITTNILAQLKSETLSNHQQLEKNLILKLKGIQSPEDYIRILQHFYAYFGGLEDEINKYIGVEELRDFADRRKTLSIKNDILVLGGEVPSKAPESSLPEIGNTLQAFGALYVIEGSTLGGQVISKMISRQLNISGSEGISFFESYGDDTMTMWEGFKTVLEYQSTSQDDADVITKAANETFAKFSLWMENN